MSTITQYYNALHTLLIHTHAVAVVLAYLTSWNCVISLDVVVIYGNGASGTQTEFHCRQTEPNTQQQQHETTIVHRSVVASFVVFVVTLSFFQ